MGERPDLIVSGITSAISVPPAPFQSRPTFQQTVSVTRNLP